jgi:hypothetical protein
MPEWLTNGVASGDALAPLAMATRLLAALVCGAAVALIYRLSHGREHRDNRTLSATLVLLSVLIAMVSMVIGDSVAKAFSLVGALSIVRFRTVVDDTRDTAFVIFAVIVGMAAGADVLLLPLVGIPIVGVAAIAMSRLGASGNGGRTASPERKLVIRLGLGFEPAATLAAGLAEHTTEHCLVGTATARQGTAIEVSYEVRLRPGVDETAMVASLNKIEGVQSVELRRS